MIEGNSEIKVNSRKKIKLPSYSLAEANDEIAIYSFPKEDLYILLNIKDVFCAIEQIDLKIKNSSDIEEKIELRSKKMLFYRCLKEVVTVDKNNCIKLNEESQTIFKCEAKRKHLTLEKLK